MKRVSILAIFFVTLSLFGCGDDSYPWMTPVIRQWTAGYSGITQPEYHLILTKTEWQSIKERLKPEELRKLPGASESVDMLEDFLSAKIDFKREMCLMVFMGRYDTWNLVAYIVEQKDKIIFRFYPTDFQVVFPRVYKVVSGTRTYTYTDPDDRGINWEPRGKLTPFGFYVLPRTNRKIVLQEGICREKAMPPRTWELRKEFHPSAFLNNQYKSGVRTR